MFLPRIRSWLALPCGDASALQLAVRSEAEGFLIDRPEAEGFPAARAALDGRTVVLLAPHPDFPGLAEYAAGGVDGIAVPVANAAELQRLGARLAVAEAESRRADGALMILACIRSPDALFGVSGLRAASPRLAGVIWEAGGFAPGVRATARQFFALAAATAKIAAIDGGELVGQAFEADCRLSREAGFAARITTDPGRIGDIHRLYAKPTD